jgi:hypothetical protein
MSDTTTEEEIESDEETAAAGDERILGLIVLEAYTAPFGAALLSFYAGERVTDPVKVIKLIELRAPVAEFYNEDDVIACPHCSRWSTIAMLAH